jgi:putative PEP-CTERM system histidine kinase
MICFVPLVGTLQRTLTRQSPTVDWPKANAEKYRHNPQFVDDAIDTIAHSVARMRRLMAQLSSGSSESVRRELVLGDVILDAIRRVEPRLPKPVFDKVSAEITLVADRERLTTVFEHLFRNAQDATDDDGHIEVECAVSGSVAKIKIHDDGCGMSSEFIRKRLFRPFDSTKGSESMGIGAYQAREYVRELGGQLSVSSEPDDGTTFSLSLPLAGE